MSEFSLLPEQKELLRRLVEARNHLLPDRETFHYMLDSSTAGGYVILMHRGWPKDSPKVLLSDLKALEAGGYILRESYRNGGEFELTGKALSHCEETLRSGGENAEVAEEPADAAPSLAILLGEGSADRPVFLKRGQMWILSYEGEIKCLKNALGMDCLWFLISHRGEEYGPAELAEYVDGAEPSVLGRGSAASHSSLEESGLSVSGHSEGIEVADAKAVSDARIELQEVRKELASAQERNDRWVVEQLDQTKKALIDYINEAVRPGGLQRKVPGGCTRARWRVDKRIARALETIEKLHPSLWRHLKNSISTSPPYVYRPDREIDWLL